VLRAAEQLRDEKPEVYVANQAHRIDIEVTRPCGSWESYEYVGWRIAEWLVTEWAPTWVDRACSGTVTDDGCETAS
jgi:hypothetical protein